MIAVENLYFSYRDGAEVLHGVNLEIADGEFLAIMGENGAGKTTLIKHFNGLLKPNVGRVLVDGVDTRDSSVASLSRNVGIVFQNPSHQFFSETVREEVAFGLRNFGYSGEVVRKEVDRILETLELTRYAETSPFMLSGGEMKRVALASVLVWNPKHIILDEPTIGQDYRQKEKLRKLILQLNMQGKTVVIVTHDVEFVADCKPTVVLLSRGRVLGEGPAEEVLVNQKLVDEASLLRPQIAELMGSLLDLGVPGNVIDTFQARRILAKSLLRV